MPTFLLPATWEEAHIFSHRRRDEASASLPPCGDKYVISIQILLDAAASTCRSKCKGPDFALLTLFSDSMPPGSLTETRASHPHPPAKAK